MNSNASKRYTPPSAPVSHGRLLLLSGLLLLAFALMVRLQQMSTGHGTGATSPEAARIEGLSYRNPKMGFLVQAPSAAWTIAELALPDSLPAPGVVHHILANTTAVVELSRQDHDTTRARCELGVFNLKEAYSAQAVAEESWRELSAAYRSASDSVRLVAPVTVIPSAGSMQGAFYVARLPQAALTSPLDVWVMAYLVRDRIACALTCQTSEAAYPRLREDFEKIIASFRWL
ncbi:MAG: hypothetical protein ONB48_09475 [candidate division KSB1 bacterium]|nr:hypothetical protein [candidate division KSB1 bacterium]MDZ7273716.1 hypothetical protein [candidate division KSB1 bacterium]MDZ7285872.1 hypothetical protein [candidate division KSB1 bacterium]MDZ7298904.1 hypothetical protein [candidate division KSB1 bacterium]MDZ7309468.1 hypothetical protein [candidate division KSB1 bacterium]